LGWYKIFYNIKLNTFTIFYKIKDKKSIEKLLLHIKTLTEKQTRNTFTICYENCKKELKFL